MIASTAAIASQKSVAPCRVRVADLCCGMGGLSVAARGLGMTVVAGVDLNPHALRTYAKNFPDAEAIEGSVQSSKVVEQCRELLALYCDVTREWINNGECIGMPPVITKPQRLYPSDRSYPSA